MTDTVFESTADALEHRWKAAGLRSAMSWGTRIPWADGGPDPLDVVVLADPQGWLLFVGLGLSECEEKRSDRAGISGFGFELTMRVACPALCEVDFSAGHVELFHLVPFWPVTVLNSLARYVFKFRKGFVHTDFMDMSNAPWRAPYLGFFDETLLGTVATKNGNLTFRSIVPLANQAAMEELAKDGEGFFEQLRQDETALLWTDAHAPEEPEVPPTEAAPEPRSWWRRLFGR